MPNDDNSLSNNENTSAKRRNESEKPCGMYYDVAGNRRLLDALDALFQDKNNKIQANLKTGVGVSEILWIPHQIVEYNMPKPDGLGPAFPNGDPKFSLPAGTTDEEKNKFIGTKEFWNTNKLVSDLIIAANDNRLFIKQPNENYPRIARYDKAGSFTLSEPLDVLAQQPLPEKPGWFKTLMHKLNSKWFAADFDNYNNYDEIADERKRAEKFMKDYKHGAEKKQAEVDRVAAEKQAETERKTAEIKSKLDDVFADASKKGLPSDLDTRASYMTVNGRTFVSAAVKSIMPEEYARTGRSAAQIVVLWKRMLDAPGGNARVTEFIYDALKKGDRIEAYAPNEELKLPDTPKLISMVGVTPKELSQALREHQTGLRDTKMTDLHTVNCANIKIQPKPEVHLSEPQENRGAMLP